MSETSNASLLPLTAQIISAHVIRNVVPAEALAGLIQQTYQALAGLGGAQPPTQEGPPTPAVPIRRSVFPDYIVCLEDGKKMKTLKRHLRSAYGLTPAAYRERWGLSADYPMVAPSYTERRSVLAKQIGLGRRAAQPVPPKVKAAAVRRRGVKVK